MKRATLVAAVTARPCANGHELASLPDEVDWLELRADLAGDVPVAVLRQHFSGQTMYSLRSKAAGGRSEASAEQRRVRLIRAAEAFDFVELEGPGDFTPEILAGVPPEKRIVSCHAAVAEQRVLAGRFRELAEVPARYYRLTCPAECVEQSVVPLLFLKSLARADVTMYATGASGFWTRIIAPNLGWPVVFGTAGDPGVDGAIPATRLIDDYGLPHLRPWHELYAIVGNPVSHSLSPRIHNAAYRTGGQPALFVPLAVDDFGRFWHSFVESRLLANLDLSLRGFTVASPHKETATASCNANSKIVRTARSSNLMYRSNGMWRGETTDPDGVLLNLCARSIGPAGLKVAIVGCGGSGRAIAAALKQAGSRVTLFNRSQQRGRWAMQLLDVPFVRLSQFHAGGFDIVVNATPVGRDGLGQPFDLGRLQHDTIVVDLVYGSQATPLAEFARARGLTVIDGRDILCTQVARQFYFMTGQQMPRDLANDLTQSDRLSTTQDQLCLPTK